MVLRESPVGEHATNGVAESAMREIKRQMRTLKFSLEAHVRKIFESHSFHLEVDTLPAKGVSVLRFPDGPLAETDEFTNQQSFRVARSRPD